jgi:hypothetical protein
MQQPQKNKNYSPLGMTDAVVWPAGSQLLKEIVMVLPDFLQPVIVGPVQAPALA